MDDAERGALLVQQEKLNKSIALTRDKLKEYGGQLVRVGDILRSSPQSIGFANAPGPYAASPTSAHNIVNWNDFPTREAIAELVHQLQEDEFKLMGIRTRLR